MRIIKDFDDFPEQVKPLVHRYADQIRDVRVRAQIHEVPDDQIDAHLQAWFTALQSELAMACCMAFLASPPDDQGDEAQRAAGDRMIDAVTANIAQGISLWLNSLPQSRRDPGRRAFLPK
jgi:hypothetical protein